MFVLKMDWDARIPILRMHDYMLAPLYICLLLFIGLILRRRYTRDKPEIEKYFMPALILRFIGCFCFCLLYMFYYKGGDTWAYNWGAIAMWRSFWQDPTLFYEIMTSEAGKYSYEAFNFFRETQATWYIQGGETMTVMKIAGFLYLITFQSYLNSAFILAFLSMLACWKIFEVFIDIYPHLHKHFALGILFVPSIFFWGAAGLMKDTFVLIGLGFCFWGLYFLFLKRQHVFKSLIYIPFGFWLMFTIKEYVPIALAPAIVIWFILEFSNSIKNKSVRVFFKPFLFSFGIILGLVVFQKVGASSARYSTENIAEYAGAMQTYLKQQTEKSDGSGYDLGEYEPTVMGLVKMIPKSINVTLFRPYIWETRKPVLLPSVIEGFVSLILTLFVLFRVGIWTTLKTIFRDSTLIFSLSFALLFAFAVGFSTYNYGSLARYKLPGLPFYFVSLAIIYDEYTKRKNKKLNIANKNLNPG